LRRALARGEFDLHYQPKQAIAGGAITGMEALLRWRHAELGMVAPDRFIPIAEESGLIVPIGEWVLRTACAHAAALRAVAGIEHPRVAVNLSARQFADQALVPLIESVLAQTLLPAACLELEITESLVMHSPEQAARLLAQLKEMGVALAMDDFGTGYSSLAYLHNFPVHALKVDRSFVNRMDRTLQQSAIVKAIVSLAQNLGMGVVAEGVETRAQADALRALGCRHAQGFLFSEPLPADQAERLLLGG
jgi:EAL domain-containing protein (putative c-di-GMP-specific phosphodiesterase class I)